MGTKTKVSVIGAGFVGATCAQRIIEKELADVVLLDIVEGLPQGKALDMMESAWIESFDAKITGSGNYEDIADSRIVVVTAGLARKPGMSRDDLLMKNAEIVGGIADKIKTFSPKAIVIVVTNPLDVMSYLVWKRTGFDAKKVIGMAGVLDSSRYAHFISAELGISVKKIEAMVLGGHGDSMVPLASYTKVDGKPLNKILDSNKIQKINEKTGNAGAEIVSFLKTGSAYYSPSSAVVKMVESILLDRGDILPCSAHLDGQYGIKDVFCGVPVRLGKEGAKEVIELKLTEEESALLKKSAGQVKLNIDKLKLYA